MKFVRPKSDEEESLEQDKDGEQVEIRDEE